MRLSAPQLSALQAFAQPGGAAYGPATGVATRTADDDEYGLGYMQGRGAPRGCGG